MPSPCAVYSYAQLQQAGCRSAARRSSPDEQADNPEFYVLLRYGAAVDVVRGVLPFNYMENAELVLNTSIDLLQFAKCLSARSTIARANKENRSSAGGKISRLLRA